MRSWVVPSRRMTGAWRGPRAAGATGWIVKPFDPVKLVDAVRRVAA